MAKGDGWAVKRYICPRCKRKGLYLKYSGLIGMSDFGCMYRNCPSVDGKQKHITDAEVFEVNPELKKEKALWKAK